MDFLFVSRRRLRQSCLRWTASSTDNNTRSYFAESVLFVPTFRRRFCNRTNVRDKKVRLRSRTYVFDLG